METSFITGKFWPKSEKDLFNNYDLKKISVYICESIKDCKIIKLKNIKFFTKINHYALEAIPSENF